MMMKKRIWLLVTILFMVGVFATKIAEAKIHFGVIEAIKKKKEKLKEDMIKNCIPRLILLLT
jgi:ABC-type transporter MlaC component